MRWASAAWANRRNALRLLIGFPAAYWQAHTDTHRYLTDVVARTTGFLHKVQDPAFPWDRQEIDGRVVRFRPDGSFEVEEARTDGDA